MSESQVKITPLAGRAPLRMKEAITGSVFIAILINVFILIFVQVGVMFLLGTVSALFWTLVVLLVAADAAVCIFIFRVALNEVKENCSAPPCTIAYRSDGYIVIYHRNGSSESFPASDVAGVKASCAKLGYVLSGWAYSGSSNYGKVIFILEGQRKKKVVRYVVNCRQAADFINGLLSSGEAADGE